MNPRLTIPTAWRATMLGVMAGVMALAISAVPALAATANHYSGEATGVKVSAFTDELLFPGAAINLRLGHAGPLPDAGGGPLVEEFLNANVDTFPGFYLRAAVIRAETQGAGSTAESVATISGLALGLTHLLNLESTTLQSTATATCGDHGAMVSGSSVIEDLVINGITVNVTGDPNQTVDLGPVQLVINEQTSTLAADGSYGEITVTALRITVTDPILGVLGEIVLSKAQADVYCPVGGGGSGNPGGDIGGPCADPTYYGIFDNSDSTVATVFRFRWYNRSGRNTVRKTVPAGAIYRTWEHWVKPGTTIRVAYKDPTTGKWVNLASRQSVKGTYPPCDYKRGFEYPPA